MNGSATISAWSPEELDKDSCILGGENNGDNNVLPCYVVFNLEWKFTESCRQSDQKQELFVVM